MNHMIWIGIAFAFYMVMMIIIGDRKSTRLNSSHSN